MNTALRLARDYIKNAAIRFDKKNSFRVSYILFKNMFEHIRTNSAEGQTDPEHPFEIFEIIKKLFDKLTEEPQNDEKKNSCFAVIEGLFLGFTHLYIYYNSNRDNLIYESRYRDLHRLFWDKITLGITDKDEQKRLASLECMYVLSYKRKGETLTPIVESFLSNLFPTDDFINRLRTLNILPSNANNRRLTFPFNKKTIKTQFKGIFTDSLLDMLNPSEDGSELICLNPNDVTWLLGQIPSQYSASI